MFSPVTGHWYRIIHWLIPRSETKKNFLFYGSMAVTIFSPVPHSDWLNYSIRYSSRCNILIKQQYPWWYHGNVNALCTFLNVYNYLNIIVSKSRPLSSFHQGESLTRGISHCSQDDNLWVTGSISWPHTFGALWTFWQLSAYLCFKHCDPCSYCKSDSCHFSCDPCL